MTALTYSSGSAMATTFPTQASIDAYAGSMATSPSVVFLAGPPVALDTLAGIVLNKVSFLGLVGVCLMTVLQVVRHTRAEEEEGRAELVRAGVVGRDAAPAATLLVTGAAAVLVGARAGARDRGGAGAGRRRAAVRRLGRRPRAGLRGDRALHRAGVHPRPCGERRGPRAVRGRVRRPGRRRRAGERPGLALADRLVPGDARHRRRRDVVAAARARSSPPALLVGLAGRLQGLRDAGRRAGGRPARHGGGAAFAVGGALGLACRTQRALLLGWVVGLFALGAVYGSLTQGVEDLARSNPTLEEFFRAAGQGSLVDSFLSTMLLVLALLAGAYAVSSALRLTSEETSGRLEPLLATGLSRARWMLGTLTMTAARQRGRAARRGARARGDVRAVDVGRGAAAPDRRAAAGLPARRPGARRDRRPGARLAPGVGQGGVGGARGVVRARLPRRPAERAGLAGALVAVLAHPRGPGRGRSRRRRRSVIAAAVLLLAVGSASSPSGVATSALACSEPVVGGPGNS